MQVGSPFLLSDLVTISHHFGQARVSLVKNCYVPKLMWQAVLVFFHISDLFLVSDSYLCLWASFSVGFTSLTCNNWGYRKADFQFILFSKKLEMAGQKWKIKLQNQIQVMKKINIKHNKESFMIFKLDFQLWNQELCKLYFSLTGFKTDLYVIKGKTSS